MAEDPLACAIVDTELLIDGSVMLRGLPQLWRIDDSKPVPGGAFLQAQAAEGHCYLELPLGNFAGVRRFTSSYRFSPFWTTPAVGTREAEVKGETLWLLAEREDGSYMLLVPLLAAETRFSLRGSADGLTVVGETGDPAVCTTGGVAILVAHGQDPYALCAASARAVCERLGLGSLRSDKLVPDFIDFFGWCTWDAFYKEVSPDKVLAGLEAFAQGGVEPRLLILDDGWQQWERASTGEDRLVSLAPNERFGGDLGTLVRESKERYRIQRFLVWHALLGYWGGLSETALPGYDTRTVARSFGPGILEQQPRWNVMPWGAQMGVPSASKIGKFYTDYHASLARQGVDGVKVDVQAMLESVSAGQGGRVKLARTYREALESSVKRNLAGRLINCMSCTTECALLATDSLLVRTSDDFFPQRPESHGVHLHANAMIGMWFGEFIQPDWDMFQSSHPRGAYHAAARAVSGGPVYVSDKPGAHDFELLRKLVLSDGSVLRADLPGRPTLDCLFADPTRDPLPLKIFNRNSACSVVGLFNLRHGTPGDPIECSVAPSDVPAAPAGAYAAYAQRADRLWQCEADTHTALALAEGEWELVSFAPVESGFAALGLADKFNSTGAIANTVWRDGACEVTLRDGGRFVAWCERPPTAVQSAGVSRNFTFEPDSGRLSVEVPAGGPCSIVVRWS